MLIRIALLISLSFGYQLASAKGIEDSTPEQRAAIQTEFMKSHLQLTPDQLQKIEALNLKYAQQMEPILKGSDGFMAKRSKAQGVMTLKDKELSSVLTADQFKAYDDLKDDLKEAVNQQLAK
jgi:hypothetical protein